MTLEEAIKNIETVAEENQRVIDTHIVFDDVTIDMLYCDDTEVIDEHLANYQECVEEHRQLAEWLKDYKRLLEQKPILEKIRSEIEELKPNNPNFKGYFEQNVALNKVLEIIDKYMKEVRD